MDEQPRRSWATRLARAALASAIALFLVVQPGVSLLLSMGWCAFRPSKVLLGSSLFAFVLLALFPTGPLEAWMRTQFRTGGIHCHLPGEALSIANAVVEWSIDHDRGYPSGLDVLTMVEEGEVPYLRGDGWPLDPWGRPWNYRPPGPDWDLRVWSWGADGLPGGEGLDADVDQAWRRERAR